MKALDLYCGAGGASMGLYRAGYDVTGVDLNPQPNYPFEFIQMSALDVDLSGYDLIWASPPCQAFTWSAKQWHKEYPDLVDATRQRLILAGVPYIIENVIGAPLVDPQTLCGTMFGLKLIRHRLFETNFDWQAPPHHRHTGTVRHGDYFTVAGHGGNGRRAHHLWVEAMGIDWMTNPELAQAIPPAYSEYIANQLTWERL